jgi:hypothetical protein
VSTSPTEVTSGSRWSIKGWRSVIREQGINDTALWEQMKLVIFGALLSVGEQLREAAKEHCPGSGQCFQLLGTDIDVDANLKPWLIESNVNPSLTSKVPFERLEKTKMIQDMFHILGIANYDTKALNKAVHTNITAFLEKLPEKHFLRDLSSKEVNSIVDYEYEVLFI